MKIIMAEEFNNQLYVRADVIQLHIKEAIEAEREKVAQWMITRSYATGHGDTTEDLLAELAWQIQEQWERIEIAEREACREICRDLYYENVDNDLLDASLAIGERGQE